MDTVLFPRILIAWLLSFISLTYAANCTGDLFGPIDALSESLSDCWRWGGKIIVLSPPSSPLDPTDSMIALPPTLEEVVGSLEFRNICLDRAQCTISLSNLQTVKGKLIFRSSKLAGVPKMDSLEKVDSLTLSRVTFEDSEQQFFGDAPNFISVRSMNFTDCIGLSAIGPMQSFFRAEEAPAAFVAVANRNLTSIQLSGYSAMSTDVFIVRNGFGIAVSIDMTEGSLSLGGVDSFTANGLESLTSSRIPGSDTTQRMISNQFTALDLSSLQRIDDATAVMIQNNGNLSNLDLSSLTQVSTLEIAGNAQLSGVDFPKLAVVGQLLNISGPIDVVSLPEIKAQGVAGQVDVASTSQFDCQSIHLPESQYNCVSTLRSEPNQVPSSGDEAQNDSSGSSSGESSSGGLSTHAKIGVGVGVGIGVPVILAIAFFLWWRSRRSNERNARSAVVGEGTMTEQPHSDGSPTDYGKAPVSNASAEEQSRQSHHRVSSELGDTRAPQERAVAGPEGRVELEEQQGPRHEMDARSLPDIDIDNDGEETRSLQDIERAHSRTG